MGATSGDRRLRFCMLGPIGARWEATDGELEEINIGGPRQRRLLAALLLGEGQTVTTGRLIDAVWGDEAEAPDTAAKVLLSYLSRLRSALGSGIVATREGGYALLRQPDDLDADRFARLASSLRNASPSAALAAAGDGLALWQGRAIHEFATEPWARGAAARLEELRLVALEAVAQARLDLGSHAEVVPELERLVVDHPLRERFRAQLMVALYRSGRQAEALRAYQDHRTYLALETGLDPSRELEDLEHRIAIDDPSLGSPDRGRTRRGYVLGEVIGEGAFGTVYRAAQPSVGREVAVKVVRAELADDPAYIRRFESEARLVARLEHPHIVPLYDYWREPGGAYLVFRLLRGGTAGDKAGPWPLARVDQVVTDVAGALATAHAVGVVHRDVKPENILFDEDGRAYLSDFGIAISPGVAEGLPNLSTSAGSPLYASPEQVRSGVATAASDQYALAVVAWELLTGTVPFAAERLTDLLRAKLERPLPQLADRRSDVPDGVGLVLRRASAVHPDDRYPSVAAFISAWATALRDASRHAATTRDLEPWSDGSPDTGLTTTLTQLWPDTTNPYKGLRPFDEADAQAFFGRDDAVEDLVRLAGERRFAAVVGPSGSGKSSMVRAGYVPRARAGGDFVAVVVPGAAPVDELADALAQLAVRVPGDLRERLVDDLRFPTTVGEILPDDGSELVVVLDQFEELWTNCRPDTRDRLLAALVAALSAPGSRLRLVVTVRADFYDRPLGHALIGPLVRDATYALAPLDAEGLRQAIVGPAHHAGVHVESSLVATLLADVAAQANSLPQLQYVLTELFDRRQGSEMTLVDYQEMGGLTGALTNRAEAVHEALDDDGRRAARRLFLRLVTAGDGTEDTRRRARRQDLATVPDEVVEAFGSARLLSFDVDKIDREPTVEVAHEALIRQWQRLRSWLDDDRESLRLTRHLAEAARSWNARGRDSGDLYRGGRLEAAADWADSHGDDLNDAELTFIAASLAHRQAEEDVERARRTAQARQNARLRRLLAVVGVVALLAATAGIVALQQRARARRAASAASGAAFEAETRRLVSDASQLVATNPRVALLLAAEAYRRAPSVESLGSLQRVLVGMGNVLGYLGAERFEAVEWVDEHRVVAARAEAIDLMRDSGETERSLELPGAHVLAVTDDGSTLAAGFDGRVVIIGLDDVAAAPRVLQTGDLVQALAFSPGGAELAVGTRAGDLLVVEVASNAVVTSWRAHPERTIGELHLPGAVSEITPHMPQSAVRGVTSVAFDPDSSVVASAGWGWARIWEPGTATPVAQSELTNPLGGSSVVATAEAVAFRSIAGERRLVVADRGRVRLIDPRSGVGVREVALAGSESTAFTVADRQPAAIAESEVVAARGVRAVDVTSLSTMSNIASYDTTAADVTDLAVSPQSDRVAVASSGGLVLLSLDGDGIIARAFPATGVGDVVVSREGDTVVRSAVRPFDWEVVSEEPSGGMRSVADPAIEYLAVLVGIDGYAAAVNTPFDVTVVESFESTAPVFPVQWRHPGGVPSASVSASGGLLALGSLDGFVEVYDWPTGAHRGTFHETELLDAQTSAHNLSIRANGEEVSIVGSNGAAAVWNVVTGEKRTITPPGGDTSSLAYSPDGSVLATVRTDGTIVLRDANSLQPMSEPFVGDTSSSAASLGPWFSADGRYLITTGDGNGRLWDIASQRQVGGVFPSDPEWNGAASLDGRWLMTGRNGQMVRWDLDVTRWPDLACRAAGRNLTADEWRQFGPSRAAYRPTCPNHSASFDADAGTEERSHE